MPSNRPPVATVSMWLPVITGGSVLSGGQVPDDVPDLVDVDPQTEVAHPADHEIAPAPVVVGQGEARGTAAVDRADLRERVQPRLQARGARCRARRGVDGVIGRCRAVGPARACTPRRLAARIAATIAGVDEIVGGSPTPLAPKGAPGSGSSINVASTVGRVERGRDEVVGEAGVAHPAVFHDQLLHHRQADTLGDAALDLARDLERVEHPPDVLRGGEVDDTHEAELGVDVDDRAVRGARERHVRIALPVGVERVGEPVVVLAGHVDRAVGRERGDVEIDLRRVRRGARASSSARAARHAFSTAPPDIIVWRLADVEPADAMVVSAGATITSSTPAPCGRSAARA